MEIKQKTPEEVLNSLLYFNIDMLELLIPTSWHSEYPFIDEEGRELQIQHGNNAYTKEFVLMGTVFSYKPINAKGKGYKGDCTLFETVVDGHTTSAFAIMKGGEFRGSGNNKKWIDWSKLVIYGSLFTAEKQGLLSFKISDLHEKYFPTCIGVARLDLCADYEATKPDIIPLFDKLTKWERLYGTDPKNKDYFETYYADKLSKEQNKYHLRRIYDKKIECFESGKAHLYPYMATASDVQRVEVEFRHDLLIQLNLKAPDIFHNTDLHKKLFQTYLSSISSYYEKHDFDKVKPIYHKIELNYLKAIPDNYLKYFGSYVERIFRDCSYKGLCQILLQPTRKTAKFKKVDGKFIEVDPRSTPIWEAGEKRKYQSETLQTVIDPLGFLDVYIRYLMEDVHVPISSINTVLKRRYVKDTRKEYLPEFGVHLKS